MRKSVPILLLILSVLFCRTGSSALIWKQGQGWSIEGEEADATALSSVELLNKAEGFENSGDTKRALTAYRGLVKKFPFSPGRAQGAVEDRHPAREIQRP